MFSTQTNTSNNRPTGYIPKCIINYALDDNIDLLNAAVSTAAEDGTTKTTLSVVV